MAFKIRKIEEFQYSSPQEMYQDNKLKKIMGPLDYQSAMIDAYMKHENSKTIALELPTGSGKTLVGLLIGEYRRRKYNEKVLFLCPTKQLVNQVVEQAKVKYGIDIIGFCGQFKEYSASDKSKFLSAQCIGVTTYSSFFTQHMIFNDVDILIMDDVHSSEDYIISNWTINITKGCSAFDLLANLFKPYISDNDYNFLTTDDCTSDMGSWCNLLPTPLILERLDEINSILSTHLKSGNNYYSYLRINENLQECNFLLAHNVIQIRPWIAPTMTYEPFENVKQRILMSATLGRSGELERVTGINKIIKLPIVNDWDQKGLGRKFFIFPNMGLENDEVEKLISLLQDKCKRSVCLVPNNAFLDKLKNSLLNDVENIEIFEVKDIETGKDNFKKADVATVLLANRFDGVDFPDSESRLLFIFNLPKTTNIQENFLSSKMAASVLYSERIRTRIIQAVGRCSRNASDFSVVCIMGDSILNDITKPIKLKQFPAELRAELQFGIDQSLEYRKIEEILNDVNEFLCRSKNWQYAEEGIVDLRNNYMKEKNSEVFIYQKLNSVATFELEFQYSIWKKDYEKAFESIDEIIVRLDAPILSGYKSYWLYVKASVAYYLYKQGQEKYKNISLVSLREASKYNIHIRWLSRLSNELFNTNEKVSTDNYFNDIIERLEDQFLKFHSSIKLEKKIEEILNLLKSENGLKFENGHKLLGELLGYNSKNPNMDGAPDPYWIVNSKIVIVSEDKIYQEKDTIKNVPIKDVTESGRHPEWLREYETEIDDDVEIINIFVTNSRNIDESARVYAKDIYYINRDDYVEWAIKALNVIRSIYKTFNDTGDSEWRNISYQELTINEVTPKDYINFIKKQKLSEI